MRLFYENLFDTFPAVSTTENPNYPITNLQDHRLTRLFKTQNPDEQEIDIDLGGDFTPEVIAIAEHNISASATMKIQGSSVSDYSSIGWEQSLTHRSDIIVDFIIPDSSYRYWRLYIDDPTNGDNALSIGKIFLGNYLEVEPNFLEVREKINNSDSVAFSQSRQAYGDLGYKWKEFSFDFFAWSNSMKKQIEVMDEYCRAGTPLFLVISNEEYDYFQPFYVVQTESIDFRLLKELYWSASLTFEEVR